MKTWMPLFGLYDRAFAGASATLLLASLAGWWIETWLARRRRR